MAGSMPMPPLDGAPPSPPGLKAGPGELAPMGADPSQSGSLQLYQLGLEIGSSIAQQLDLLGQTFPQLAPMVGMMQSQLKDGLRNALQQGLSKPEAQPGMGMAIMNQAGSGRSLSGPGGMNGV